jgi:hypothetical protein
VTHESLDFFSAVNGLAHICGAVAEELVGYDSLFAGGEGEEGCDVVDARFERVLWMSAWIDGQRYVWNTHTPYSLEEIPKGTFE